MNDDWIFQLFFLIFYIVNNALKFYPADLFQLFDIIYSYNKELAIKVS